MKKLSILLIAALLIIAFHKTAKADIEFDYSCGCQTSSPSPTPTTSPTETPTLIPSPTPTETPLDVCPNLDGIQTSIPNDYHMDAAGKNCVQFQMGGAPPPPNVTSPQVLGTSTSVLAATGVKGDHINPSIQKDGPTNLIISKLNLNLAISPSKVDGNNWEVFDDRVAWLASSALPGSGNTILYTHERPGLFLNLYRLKIGDEIKIYHNSWLTYKITKIKVVNSSDTASILSDKNQLVLFTCSGLKDQKRLIIYASLN